MFNFKKDDDDDDQSSAATDNFTDANTVTSLSDASSESNVEDLQQDDNEASAKSRPNSMNVGLADERMSRQRPLLDLVDRLRSFG